MMSMYGFESQHLVPTDEGTAPTAGPVVRFVLGALLVAFGLYGAAHSFDPVTLSVVQVFFLLTIVLGVAVAAFGHDVA